MTIKTILAALTSRSGAPGVMAASCALARRHGAHLIGLRPVESLTVYPGVAMHFSDSVLEGFANSQVKETLALQAIFDRYTQREDFVSEWRVADSATQTTAERIVASAGAADIVVAAAVDKDTNPATHMKLLEAIIRESGRPVMVVPENVSTDVIGGSVVIGWNGARESVRAAHDTLNLMQPGDEAYILHVEDSRDATDDGSATRELAICFARHGIETTIIQKTWTPPGIAAALNKEAFERGADMIAIGAFGHSRTYDFIIGSATRELLRETARPVLFSR